MYRNAVCLHILLTIRSEHKVLYESLLKACSLSIGRRLFVHLPREQHFNAHIHTHTHFSCYTRHYCAENIVDRKVNLYLHYAKVFHFPHRHAQTYYIIPYNRIFSEILYLCGTRLRFTIIIQLAVDEFWLHVYCERGYSIYLSDEVQSIILKH